MKTTYRIFLPIIHGVLAVFLVLVGSLRILTQLISWFWLNDLVYALIAAGILIGHYRALRWGREKGFTCARLLFGLNAIDYAVFGLHTAFVIYYFFLFIFFVGRFEIFYNFCFVVFSTIALNIFAIIIRKRTSERYLFS